MADIPSPPQLSPEETKSTIAQFQQLPSHSKQQISRVLHSSCSWCEKELKIPNVAFTHGICKRHAEKEYSQLGFPPPKETSKTPDLKHDLSSDELDIAVKLHSIVRSRKKSSRLS